MRKMPEERSERERMKARKRERARAEEDETKGGLNISPSSCVCVYRCHGRVVFPGSEAFKHSQAVEADN